MLKISFLGGLGEFGRNMTLYEKDGHTLIVDCGMMFPETDLPGVDRVIPDFQYLMETRGAGGCALLITHAHEDHLGAVPFLLRQLPMPVMASPFALGLLENKLEEMDIELQEVRELSNGKKETFGPFEIEPIYVTHSIPEAFSMAIRTGDGTFVHSSDFKFDQTPLDGRLTSFNRFQDYGGMGVTALLVDSTNSEVGGMAGSEKTVFKGLESHISSAGERLIISLFSTNIQRIQGILDLASRYRKKVVFLGRSLLGNIEVSERLGHLRYPPNVVIGTEDIPKVRPSDMIVVATGSQGEPFSAMSRIAFDEIKNISIREGDTVIFSARIIPGNEKRIGRIINQVYRKGGRVVTPAEDPSIHVSGHGAKEEIKLLASWVRGKYYVPIHGEFRQLKENGELAREMGYPDERILVSEVGDSLVFENGELIGRSNVPAGTIWLDGESGDPVGKLLLRDRRHLGNEGFVLPIVVVNSQDGRFEADPEIIHRGYPPLENQQDLSDDIKRALRNLAGELTRDEMRDQNIVRARVKSAVKKTLKKNDAKIPLVIPVVMEV
ncbi:MAG TPA: ribonuclease J [Acidobacteriota bacterium]|nr:ribonuclease J [Acidobacteriota bacterium]HNT17076.1 ribonuclease J [Acidobacteriota bacterium]HPA26088.1 ribonuclease J [Acidobacteriota bacterium]HQO19279.1 ribonuclease J [Acidobacteriota bacterium]HQQ46091.1 ribonuclease J [Acidobacteriota bacterium]